MALERSLAEALPYRATRTVPTRQQWPLSMVLLKDGTVATAFRLSELDTFAMSTTERNAISACFVEALHVLPPGVFLQVIFETGDDYDELIDAFAERSDPSSHPILKRSRKLRADACRAGFKEKKPRITYWLGWRGALCRDTRVLRRFRRSLQREPTKYDILGAGQALADVIEEFLERLSLTGLTGEALSEAEIAADLHRAVNPTRYRDTPPPFCELSPGELSEALSFADAATLVLLHGQADWPVVGAVPVLDDRAEVHQATGVVSVQAGVGLADALVLLRARAFTDDRSLADLARDVLAGAVDFGKADDDG